MSSKHLLVKLLIPLTLLISISFTLEQPTSFFNETFQQLKKGIVALSVQSRTSKDAAQIANSVPISNQSRATAMMTTIASDDFSSGNGLGGSGWAGNWALTNASVTSPSPGGFTTGSLLFMDGASFGTADRTVDLSGYSSATLTFDYECHDSSSGFENDDFVRVRVSTDGGSNFSDVFYRDGDQICPSSNNNQSGNISVAITVGNANTVIRFESGTTSNSEDIYWDNIVVEGVSIPIGNLTCTAGATEITGTVFEDYNYDGDYDQGENLGVENIMATATDSLGNSFTDNTDASGDFAITGLIVGRTYRIEFTNIPSGFSPTLYGGDNGTKVQFIQSGNCANLGIKDILGPCSFNGGNGGIGESAQWIYIGDTLNPPDGASYSTVVSGSSISHNDVNQIGRGAVDYEFWILDNHIRIGDYLEFLNVIDPANGSERWEAGLLTNNVAPTVVLIEYDSGEPLGSRWKPIAYTGAGQNLSVADMEKIAVSFISFPLAARYANWVATGDINQGAYTFDSPTSATANITAIDQNWTGIRLPTEDEIYKVLYWDQSNLTYNLYGTTTLDANGIPILSDVDANGLLTVANGNVYGLTSHGGNQFHMIQTAQGGKTPYGLYFGMGDFHDMVTPYDASFPLASNVVRPGNQFNAQTDMRSSYRLLTSLTINDYYPSPSFRLGTSTDPCVRPIEIGNYIWEDTDEDGIQDAGELGIADVRVELYDNAGALLAFDITNSLGQYSFSGNGIDNASWQTANDTLAANTNYYIVAGGNGQFSAGEMILSGTTYTLTTDSLGSSANRYEIDSDGTIAVSVDSDFDGEPYVQVTTGKSGQVDHSFDFGFLACIRPTASVFAIQPSCNNDAVLSDGYLQISTYANGDKYNFSTGSTYSGDTDFGNAFPIGALPFKFNTGLSNPTGSQDYTVRIFNAKSSCYTDFVVTMNEQDCAVGCNCTDYLFVNDIENHVVHKLVVNAADGSLTELFRDNGDPWLPTGNIDSPHGLAIDQNGFLYIGAPGDYSSTGGKTIKLDADGNVLEDPFIDMVWGYNTGSMDNYYILKEPYNTKITAYDLCTKAEVGSVEVDPTLADNAFWGLWVEDDGTIYSTDNFQIETAPETGEVYRGQFSISDFTNPATVNLPAIVTGLPAATMGVTADPEGNIYVISGDRDAYGPCTIYKYDKDGNLLVSATDNDNSDGGFWGSRGLVYSEASGKIYVASNGEKCIACLDPVTLIVDPTCSYIAPNGGNGGKGIGVKKLCCPSNNNITIDTVLCDANAGDIIYLQDLIACEGIIAEGEWTASGGNTGVTYDACNLSFTIDNTAGACGSFVLESDGVGNTLQCGAFVITVNVIVASLEMTVTQTSCVDNNDGTFTANYDVVIDWSSAPCANGEVINVTRNGVSIGTIDPTTDTSPTTIAASFAADGVGTQTFNAAFSTDICSAENIVFKTPSPCAMEIMGSDAGEICANAGINDISGTVFEDWNYDGTMNQSDTIGVSGVEVILTDCAGNEVGKTFTDANGNYIFDSATYPALGAGVLSGKSKEEYRVEFVLPESVSCWAKPTQVGADNGTMVQFVQPGNCASLGLASPGDFCNEDVQFITACYVQGPSNDATYGGNAGIVSFLGSGGSNSSTDETLYDNPTAHPVVVPVNQIGAVWGIAYDRANKKIFTSAGFKSHSGFGPLSSESTGAIYLLDNSTNTGANSTVTNASVFIDLNSASYFNGATGATTNPNSSMPGPYNFSYSDELFSSPAKTGLGDLEISDDGQTLFTINLNTQELYEIPIGSNTTAPIKADILVSSMPSPTSCTGDTVRPFALAYHKGLIYVGMVCAAEVSGDSTKLRAYVYEYTPGSGEITGSPVLEFPLNYDRGITSLNWPNPLYAEWQPWINTWDNTKIQYQPSAWDAAGTDIVGYPQPVLTDITFDRGDMILGFSDRFGDQFSWGPDPAGSGKSNLALPAGDILRAGYNGNGTWTIEQNATVVSSITGSTTTAGIGNVEGPAPIVGGVYSGTFGEYYFDDAYPNEAIVGFTAHDEITLGGLLQIPGNENVVSVVYDPVMAIDAEYGQGGIAWLKNKTGAWSKSYRLYDESAANTYGKGNGFGDIEALCSPAPIEIGNYVWEDTNEDGIQDACEPGIENVRVELYNISGELIAFDTTDTNGQYYFSHSDSTDQHWIAATDSIEANTMYYISVGSSDFSSNVLSVNGVKFELTVDSTNSGANRYSIDNDGTIAANIDPDFDGKPYTKITTGNAGEVDHSFDFGFKPINCSEITELITARSICSGENVDTLAILTTFENPDSIAFVYFDTAQTDSSVIYTSGMSIDTIQISASSDTVRITNVSGFINTSSTPDTFYVYAIAHPTPSGNTCRPYEEILVIVQPSPTASVFAIQPSCNNNVVQADGYLQISTFANGDKYNWVTGSDYIAGGGDPDYADALTIGALPFKFNTGISNPTGSQDYTIRIFNSNGCFTDYTITMNQQDCAIGCNCEENIYLNETTTGGSVHKFEINSDGSLSEIGMPWYDNAAAGGELISPHGLAADLNGFLYIGESSSASEIRRFTCDGEILPESEFAISTAGQFNIGSIGNTLYVGERDFSGIVAYDLCTGVEVSRLQFCENTGNLAGNWGFFIDPVTQKMYATNSQTPWVANRVWSFDESQFTATGLPCVSNIDTIRNDANSPLRDARFMGITTDPSENIYIVVDDDTNYSGAPSYVLKYGPAPFHPFIAISPLDSLADGTGFNDAHAIVYSETSGRIYVSTNSAFDDCVAIFDTDLNYLGAAVPSPGDGSQAKGMTILKECCPINNNVTIDTTLCVASLNDSFYLQEIINCTGIICEGMWTPSGSNTGMTYNSCGNTIKITDLNACGTFTLTSDGVGNNLQCGAFVITVNISVGDITAPVVAGNQTVCNGGNPTAFTIATPATGSNTITYQWQSTTDTLSGFTNIPSGTNAIYDPVIGISDTTYYRVIAAVLGGCSTGNCQDTSNLIIVTVVNCDYGDLPDIADGTTGINDYETYDSTGGPSHKIITGLFLGDTVDVDNDGFPNAEAIGDDSDGTDDEDGITKLSSIDVRPGGTIRLPLNVTNTTGDTAYIEAWIDWNGDGDFDETGEMVIDLKDNKDGVFPAYLEIAIPNDALTGSMLGFRIRLSNTDNMTPYGQISSGEVEDYLLGVDCPQGVCLPIGTAIKRE